MSDGTVLQALCKLSGKGSTTPSFDSNPYDYDILLRLLSDAGLHRPLSRRSKSGLTLFAVQDIGLMQTARDIITLYKYNLPARTEKQAYRVLRKFLGQFRNRKWVLKTILRNHMIARRMTMAVLFHGHTYRTLAKEKIWRSGVSFKTTNPMFPKADYAFASSVIRTKNGNVHVLDRMLVPKLLDFPKKSHS